ncbi:MAG: hypothetical protein JNK47_02510 [Mesorhizobium sp.]|nr:hypothetical protein [Mesorhizobium sp.]MBL8576073.1 hypothetical protein [Mesorhizobium sp.]
MKNRRSRRYGAIAVPPGLALAPMVAAMRLPLLAAEAGTVGKIASETGLAVREKIEAAAEGIVAAQWSLFSSALSFWPEILSGKTPSVISGAAAERSLQAALAPASRRVRANYRRLSKR